MVDKKGNVVDFNAEHIAAVEDSEIEEFINYAIGTDDERGIFTYDTLSYAFLKTNMGEMVKLTIMDCTRSIFAVNYHGFQ